MTSTIFGIRLTLEAKEQLQSEALARGLTMAGLIKERLAIGRTLPPHISNMLDKYAKFIQADREEILRRIVVWHFAMIEAEIQLTGETPPLLAQAPFVRFDRELSDRELFEYATGTIIKTKRGESKKVKAPEAVKAQ